MATFSDDFERADGPPGANWTIITGSVSIASGNLVGSAVAAARPTSFSEAGDVSVSAVFTTTNLGSATQEIGVRSDGAGGRYFYCEFTYSAGNGRARIYYYDGIGSELLATDIYNFSPGSTITCVFSATGTTYSASMDGAHIVSVVDESATSGGYVTYVIRTGNGSLESIGINTVIPASMEVTPDPVWVGGGLVELTATGTDTNWNPENPADTIFTVDHGEITAQSIDSATVVTLFYTPADYLGTITFSESKYSLSDEVNATVIPPEGQGVGNCLLTPEGADLINDTGANYPNYDLLTQGQVIVPAAEGFPAVDIVQAISNIWYILTGGTVPGSPYGFSDLLGEILTAMMGDTTPTVSLYEAARTTSIREELEAVRDSLTEMRGDLPYTLRDVRDALGGDPFINHQDLLSAISGIPAGSNQDVLDWLNLYLGTTGPTLEQFGTMISDLATIAGYDLGDVLDAIAAIPGVDLTAITNKLNAIQPNESYNLTTITNTLSDIHGDLNVVRVDVDDIRGENNYTLTSVMDRLDDIAAAVSAIPDSALPLWPGLANVTLGASLPLTDGMTVPGPLHGLIFTITASAPRAQKFMFGTVASWARVGQVLFVTDRGDYERGQTYGIDQHIVTPTTMQSAASALILVNPNWEGTVRPWTRT